MSDCFINERIREAKETRHHCDGGFMGKTHATSAIAAFFVFVAFFPAFTSKALRTEDVWLLIMAAIVTAGASLIPDLDNTSSTARNSLGPIGHVFSEIIRGLSTFVQTVIRTSKDPVEPNPHRGAMHTVPASALVGLGVLGLTSIGGSVNLPIFGKTSVGDIMAVLVVFIMLHLALSGLVKPFMKKMKDSSPVGELISLAASLMVAIVLYSQATHDDTFWWLGVATFAGCVVHIIGDCFTTAGAPILFPISVFLKGRFWWNTRFLPIKAGGVVESVIFVPFFLIVIAISFIKILGFF